MERFSSHDIIASYSRHPLREETLRRRVGNPDAQVNELVLAIDEDTEVTDQNHVGGWRSTIELAVAAGVTSSSVVLDLGSGLGGPARLLAHIFGCDVYGIDFSSQRIIESRRLSEFVGLTGKVTFECADLLGAPVREASFDILWGQDAWVQIEDKRQLLTRWVRALRRSGTVAFQDVLMRRSPRTPEERRALDLVQSIWHARIIELGEWRRILHAVSLSEISVKESRLEMARYFSKLSRISRSVDPPGEEQVAWAAASHLARAGVLSYARITARPGSS